MFQPGFFICFVSSRTAQISSDLSGCTYPAAVWYHGFVLQSLRIQSLWLLKKALPSKEDPDISLSIMNSKACFILTLYSRFTHALLTHVHAVSDQLIWSLMHGNYCCIVVPRLRCLHAWVCG